MNTNPTSTLVWPNESAQAPNAFAWHHSGSNICLDLHGNPTKAKLTVFSDGNHHMALEDCCQQFLAQHTEVKDIFYATTPPGVLVNAVQEGLLQLGNLRIPALPDIFISPKAIMQQLKTAGHISDFTPIARSLGNVMLVRKSNPTNIQGIDDLLRDDIRLFISNPVTEKASHDVYHGAILGIAQEQGFEIAPFKHKIDNAVIGERIHHRECPQSLFSDQADVAVIYYHLALRYCRIFPDYFDMVPFSGSAESPEFTPANETTTYYIGLMNKHKQWGEPFKQFMLSEAAVGTYVKHGLSRV